MHFEDIVRLLAALAAGALIGFERELHDKPAGFRTNILICLGAAIFTLASVRLPETIGIGDPARIAAQVVAGVGFLGAGAILQSRGHVIGLTTAATIWAVASVGVAFGAGLYLVGIAGTLLVHGVLIGLLHLEGRIDSRRREAHFEIEVDPQSDIGGMLRTRAAAFGLRVERFEIGKDAGVLIIHLGLRGPSERFEQFQLMLLNEPSIRAFRRM